MSTAGDAAGIARHVVATGASGARRRRARFGAGPLSAPLYELPLPARCDPVAARSVHAIARGARAMTGEASGAPRGRPGWIVVLAFGLLAVGTGLYFMALRPALLPEDLRFTGLHQPEVAPALARWLRIVFRTWGGFVVGLGLMVVGHGAAYLVNRPALSRIGMAAGCVFAFASFVLSNIQLRSDFLWFIALLFVGAVASAIVVLRAR